MKEAINEIAKNVARDIFEYGDEPDSPASRMQYMGGSYDDNTEVPQGGLCEDALAGAIEKALTKHLLSYAVKSL